MSDPDLSTTFLEKSVDLRAGGKLSFGGLAAIRVEVPGTGR
jgi:hypothetical protein